MTKTHNTQRTGDDPIFAAIDTHRETVGNADAALVAEIAAAKALIGTAPTTHAGLRALEEYLRQNDHVSRGIERTVTTDGGYTYKTFGGPEAVDWLIAKRAAEIVEGL